MPQNISKKKAKKKDPFLIWANSKEGKKVIFNPKNLKRLP